MEMDVNCTSSSEQVMSQPDCNVGVSSQRIIDRSTLMPPPMLIYRKKGSHFCAIGATIGGMYDVVERNDIDDVINKFHFATGIVFHVTLSPYYKEMVQANNNNNILVCCKVHIS
jgi:hypothetical protein